MVLFCFKNVMFAKFIKQELKTNIEFSKTGSDKIWKRKRKDMSFLLSLSGQLSALYQSLHLMVPAI